jgi:hypothetical protein
VKSTITKDFVKKFRSLPEAIQDQARADYRIFKQDPNNPGLRFHQIKKGKRILYSVSIGIHYRALAQERAGGVIEWFWIGHHTVYDKLIS